jgi:hypothetical protein
LLVIEFDMGQMTIEERDLNSARDNQLDWMV